MTNKELKENTIIANNNALVHFAKLELHLQRATLPPEKAKEINPENIKKVTFEFAHRITIEMNDGKTFQKEGGSHV